MRVFPDTNVLVSAFLSRGLCADLLREVLARHELATGEVVLAELRRILIRKFGATPGEAAEAVAAARAGVVVGRPRGAVAALCRDRDDDLVVASAVAAGANLLVTGDRDLLSVAGRAPVAIVTPREAWGRLRAAAS